ncbi:MAG: hypothetical protein V4722_14295 [Bacteroidota bacterium]
MIIYCKKCGLPLTKNLEHYTGTSFGEADRQPFIQPGFYTISDGDYFTQSEGKTIINAEDLINVMNHTDKSRLIGCCGLDGLDGPNKICKNGHEVATEKSDCWMPRAIIFEEEKIIKK